RTAQRVAGSSSATARNRARRLRLLTAGCRQTRPYLQIQLAGAFPPRTAKPRLPRISWGRDALARLSMRSVRPQSIPPAGRKDHPPPWPASISEAREFALRVFAKEGLRPRHEPNHIPKAGFLRSAQGSAQYCARTRGQTRRPAACPIAHFQALGENAL